MKFSIITPTYKRPKELIRAVNSVINQEGNIDWEMIIVNDSPDHDYSEFENGGFIKNNKIKYLKNTENKGVNFSRNFALDKLNTKTDYIIFLDDDDWLNKKCLSEAIKNIKENPDYFWYVSNRYDLNKKISITANLIRRNEINYLKDYLIFKRFKGDATHIISTKYRNVRFSQKVTQAEEWIYYVQLSRSFLYYNFDSTFSDGYENKGITKNYKNKIEKLKNTYKLFCELLKLKKFDPLVWFLYLPLRIGAILLKN